MSHLYVIHLNYILAQIIVLVYKKNRKDDERTVKNQRINYTVMGAILAMGIFISTSIAFRGYFTAAIESVYAPMPSDEDTTQDELDLNISHDFVQNMYIYEFDPSAYESEPEAEDDILEEIQEGDGEIIRKTYVYSESSSCAELPNGGYIKNSTDVEMEYILEQCEKEPNIYVHIDDEPLVLIMHTHTTECYENEASDSYSSENPQRTTELDKSVVAVGEAIAEKLEENGIGVIHDRTIHDYPNYTGAYDRSAETVINYLEDYPGIKIVIDVHRDAIETDGTRYAPVAEIGGKTAAQVMIIVGNLNVPQYRYNLRFASRLQSKMETLYPGLTRPILLAERNYNQELTKGSVLIEIGSGANSLDEAIYSGELVGVSLAELLYDLAA